MVPEHMLLFTTIELALGLVSFCVTTAGGAPVLIGGAAPLFAE